MRMVKKAHRSSKKNMWKKAKNSILADVCKSKIGLVCIKKVASAWAFNVQSTQVKIHATSLRSGIFGAEKTHNKPRRSGLEEPAEKSKSEKFWPFSTFWGKWKILRIGWDILQKNWFRAYMYLGYILGSIHVSALSALLCCCRRLLKAAVHQ